MSFFSKLGLVTEGVVEEVATDKDASENKEVKTKTVNGKKDIEAQVQGSKKPSISFISPTVSVTPGQIIGKIDNEINEKLSAAIEENNLPGNDFFEFLQSLTTMASLAVDEKTKFNMVFATLSKSSGGMTKEKLIESISHYTNIIDKEKEIFQNDMEKATEDLINSKIKYNEKILASAQKKTEEIQKLNQEIQAINEEVSAISDEVAQSKTTIAQKQADFEVTVQQLENVIGDYKTKISQHIQ